EILVRIKSIYAAREERMKLFRHGAVGSERAGALDARGVKRDLSLLVPDITPDWLAPEKLQAIRAIDLEQMPAVPEGTRIGAPISGARQFIAIGLNYRKHAQARRRNRHADPQGPARLQQGDHLHPGPGRRPRATRGLQDD